MKISLDEGRANLVAGLRSRRPEIGNVVLARVRAIGEPREHGDAEYLDGLHRATEAAIEHTLESIDRTGDFPLPVPLPLLAQARLAARRRLPLETMLRRYLAGHAMLADFAVEEATRQGVAPGAMGLVLRSMAARTDLTVAAISAAYEQERASGRCLSMDRRRMELIGRLLHGELIDPVALDYDFDRWHLALVLRGEDAPDALDDLTRTADALRLSVADEDGSIWTWLGSRGMIESRSIADSIPVVPARGLRIGIGEPGTGRGGWRLSHEQARAALSVATRRSATFVRYADFALLASAMGDELLSTSLRRLYLEPLEDERDGGTALRETLRAYLAARCNVSSAAAGLRVDRRTVSNRLRVAEERIGKSLDECPSALEVALQLDRLDRSSHT